MQAQPKKDEASSTVPSANETCHSGRTLAMRALMSCTTSWSRSTMSAGGSCTSRKKRSTLFRHKMGRTCCSRAWPKTTSGLHAHAGSGIYQHERAVRQAERGSDLGVELGMARRVNEIKNHVAGQPRAGRLGGRRDGAQRHGAPVDNDAHILGRKARGQHEPRVAVATRRVQFQVLDAHASDLERRSHLRGRALERQIAQVVARDLVGRKVVEVQADGARANGDAPRPLLGAAVQRQVLVELGRDGLCVREQLLAQRRLAVVHLRADDDGALRALRVALHELGRLVADVVLLMVSLLLSGEMSNAPALRLGLGRGFGVGVGSGLARRSWCVRFCFVLFCFVLGCLVGC